MTPELQEKRDTELPLNSRIDVTIAHLAQHGWFDMDDLRRLLLDCKAELGRHEQAFKEVNRFDEFPRQAE